MVRYDIWPNHIWELRRQAIPVMIANATMRRQTARRVSLIRSFHRSVYGSMTHILTAAEADAQTFALFRLDRPRSKRSGTPASTRSTNAARRPASVCSSPRRFSDRNVLVVGSSWPEDDAVVIPSILTLSAEVPGLLVILVPHEPTVRHLEELEDARGKDHRSTILRAE